MIGEGGSGGALALAVGNEVWMLENSTYSILSPEGFASILWKDSSRAEEAAGKMRLTADDLKDLGIIEQVIGEEEPVTAESLPEVARRMDVRIEEFMEKIRENERGKSWCGSATTGSAICDDKRSTESFRDRDIASWLSGRIFYIP